MTIKDDWYYQHQMTTAPASDLLSGKGADTVHSLVSGSKHSTSVMVILKPIISELLIWSVLDNRQPQLMFYPLNSLWCLVIRNKQQTFNQILILLPTLLCRN